MKKNKTKTILIYITFLIIPLLMVGCIEEKDNPQPGKIIEEEKDNYKIIKYYDYRDVLLDFIKIYNLNNFKVYEFKGRDDWYKPFEDEKPIHCILAAINNYKERRLQFCIGDMKVLKDYFKTHFIQYDSNMIEIKELYNEKCTVDNLKKALKTQIENSHKYSTTIFAFSGHGNIYGLDLYDGFISKDTLRYYFKKLESKRVIWIIDSCNAGTIAQLKNKYQKRNRLKKREYKYKSCLFSPIRKTPLYFQKSPFKLLHCFVGKGKIIIGSSLPSQKSRDGIFIRALVSYLNSIENNKDFKEIIDIINQRINLINTIAQTEEDKLEMTPFIKIYGDIKIVVINYPYYIKY